MAAKVPISPARPSIPNLNNSATSITAAAMMKKLNPKNSQSNGVVPAEPPRAPIV